VIHEAMAASLPVIAFTDAGGAPEAIGDGAGFVVPYGDYRQVAATIQLMCNQPAVTLGLRERSLQRVQQRYRFDDYAEKLIDVCEMVSGVQVRKAAKDIDDSFQLRVHRAA
jgi:glycosyltransferase involved in cell wall biosynthesis